VSEQKFERIAISKRLRFEVFKRDGFACQYCGATPPGALLHCDHIDPVANGGQTEINNLVTACEACNLGKSSVPLHSVPESLADRAADVLEREAQIAGYQAVMKAKRLRLEAEAQQVLEFFCSSFGRSGIPISHFSSIKRFVDRLGLDSCLSAAEIAQSKFNSRYRKAFLYFCGICWRQIREAEQSSASEKEIFDVYMKALGMI
jgi:DNA-directed RNA polymerase subunit RPC12/RpoP